MNESDYTEFGTLIETAQAFARSTYQCIYITDCFSEELLYVSNNMTELCGADARLIKGSGYGLFIDLVSDSDLKMLMEISDKYHELFNSIPLQERLFYTISCDFHVNIGSRERLVHHTLTPIVLTKDGRIRLTLCVISLADNNKAGNIIMMKEGASTCFEYTLADHKWKQRNMVLLSDMEKEILYLSTQGYTMTDIATIICKSVDTVKVSKTSIFKRMGVKNITEAIVYAQNHRLM